MKYYAILTNIGAAKLANATALGQTLKLSAMAVGDGGGTTPQPASTQTALINEQRRAPLNTLRIDPQNPSQIIVEQIIPEDAGGWWVREIGLYDQAGDLIAVANCPDTYKPLLSSGSGRTQVIRMVLVVASTECIELKVDPSVVLATREYVDQSAARMVELMDYKQSALVATTASITLSGLQTVDGITLKSGDRVLVKHQVSAVENGLYLAAAGQWLRTADANTSAKVTPGMLVPVEIGTLGAGSLWQLTTPGPVNLNSTLLTFEQVAGLSGVAPGTYNSIQINRRGQIISAKALAFGTAAYRNIGTENGEIPDMGKFTSGTGWVRFPNGFLIQGGLLTTESHGGRTIPFPVAFTNKPFFITVVPHGYGAYDSMIHVNAGATLTNTYFQCYGYYQDANGFRKDVIAFSWSAAGF